MQKYIRALIICALVVLLSIGLVACSNADVPSPSVDESGVVTWQAIDDATEYVYNVDGIEKVTTECSVTIAPGQSVKVQAHLSNGKYSDWSDSVTFVHGSHTWQKVATADNVATPATCIEVGTYYYVCSICGAKGDTYNSGGRDLTNHDWFVSEVIEPTCTEGGYTVYACTRCTMTDKRDMVGALGHDYQYDGIIDPACVDGGYSVYVCTRCHDVDHRDATEALGHDWQAQDTVSPTCTAPGYTRYQCSRCFALDQRDYKPATGHAWQAQAVVAPTCTTSGYTPYACANCDATDRRDEVDALGHDPIVDAIVQPTCTEGGYSEAHCSRCSVKLSVNLVDSLGHSFEGALPRYQLLDGSVTCSDGVLESVQCVRCDYCTTRELIGVDHAYNLTVYTLPCYHGGTVEQRVCACGQQFAVDVKSNCTDLVNVSTNVRRCQDPLCGYNYLYEYYEQADTACHVIAHEEYRFYQVAVDEEGVIAISHARDTGAISHEIQQIITETETVEGEYTVKTRQSQDKCKVCGTVVATNVEARYYAQDVLVKTHITQRTVDERGYSYSVTKTSLRVAIPYSPTGEVREVEVFSRTEVCDPEGVVTQWQQIACDYDGSAPYCASTFTIEGFAEQQYQRSGVHEYVVDSTVTPATCVRDGEENVHCVWCNASDTRTVDALGHNYFYNVTRFVCTRCGNVKTTDAEQESVYLQDITADGTDFEGYSVAYYATEGDQLRVSAVAIVLVNTEQVERPLPDQEIVIEDGVIRLSFASIDALVGAGEMLEQVVLTVNDNSIVLDTPYRYSFEQTNDGLRRTATNALTGESAVLVMPYTVNDALQAAQLQSGLFAYTFEIDATGTYRICSAGRHEDSFFTFYIYDSLWQLYENSVYLYDGESTIERTFEAGTYYLLPYFGAETPYAIGLSLKRFCNHQYYYHFQKNDNVIVCEGICSSCQDPDTAVHYEWTVVYGGVFELVAEGAQLMFKFVPTADGDYCFYCEGAENYPINAYLDNAEMTRLDTKDGEKTAYNFAICYALEEGKTYYLELLLNPNSKDQYQLLCKTYCEHNYQCTYEVIDDSHIRRTGECVKCHERIDATFPFGIVLSEHMAQLVTLRVSGDQYLTYDFTPDVTDSYIVSFTEKSGNYRFFVEVSLGGELLECEELTGYEYTPYVYECEAGKQYTIQVYSPDIVSSDTELSIFSIEPYVPVEPSDEVE